MPSNLVAELGIIHRHLLDSLYNVIDRFRQFRRKFVVVLIL